MLEVKDTGRKASDLRVSDVSPYPFLKEYHKRIIYQENHAILSKSVHENIVAIGLEKVLWKIMATPAKEEKYLDQNESRDGLMINTVQQCT